MRKINSVSNFLVQVQHSMLQEPGDAICDVRWCREIFFMTGHIFRHISRSCTCSSRGITVQVELSTRWTDLRPELPLAGDCHRRELVIRYVSKPSIYRSWNRLTAVLYKYTRIKARKQNNASSAWLRRCMSKESWKKKQMSTSMDVPLINIDLNNDCEQLWSLWPPNEIYSLLHCCPQLG